MAAITDTTNTSPNTNMDQEQHKEIINAVLNLYQCNPSKEAYSHYATTAVFHDPVSIAQGKDAVQSQFNGMPKVFESSVTEKYEILESTPSKIILDLTQHYIFKGKLMPEKTINSKVTLKLDEDSKIVLHEEEWDHQPNKTGDDGFVGKMQELRKKVSSKVVEGFVGSEPSK